MPAENFKSFVVDASYVLGFLLPDENNYELGDFFGKATRGEINLYSSIILPFEVLNGLKMSVIRKRISAGQAQEIAVNFLELSFSLEEVDYLENFKFCVENGITFYDSAYVWLSKCLNIPLLTLDRKLTKV